MPPRVLLRIAGLSMASTSSRPAFKVAAISLPALQSFAPSRCVHSKSRVASPPPSIANRRRLATHSDGPWAHQAGSHHPGGKKHPETVEETLRRLEGEAQKAAFSDNHEHVGPFPLGVGPSGRRKPWKPWGDLNIKGKREHHQCRYNNISVENYSTDRKSSCHPHRRWSGRNSHSGSHYRALCQEFTERSLLSVH